LSELLQIFGDDAHSAGLTIVANATGPAVLGNKSFYITFFFQSKKSVFR